MVSLGSLGSRSGPRLTSHGGRSGGSRMLSNDRFSQKVRLWLCGDDANLHDPNESMEEIHRLH